MPRFSFSQPKSPGVGWRDIYVTGRPYTGPVVYTPPAPPPPPPTPGVRGPLAPGNVVGRELAFTGAGFLGHVGLYDGFGGIFQMMPSAFTGQVENVTWDNFRSQSMPWPTLFPIIPSHLINACFETTCDYYDPAISPAGGRYSNVFANYAMVNRARQIQVIGANYTSGAAITPAQPRMNDRRMGGLYPLELGLYRCDTFVQEIFSYSHARLDGGYDHDVMGFNTRFWHQSVNESVDWSQKIQRLRSAVRTPITIYNTIKTFQ